VEGERKGRASEQGVSMFKSGAGKVRHEVSSASMELLSSRQAELAKKTAGLAFLSRPCHHHRLDLQRSRDIPSDK
jgi:hypothetical protein